MTKDALTAPVNGDTPRFHDLGQLLRDVREHVVVHGIFGAGSIEVEPGPGSELPVVVWW